jgi:hypothetical protein
MSTGTGQPSEEELQAAYEAELKRIRVEQIVLEQVVTLINLGMRRTGLAPETADERDLDQVRVAIEGVRALMPLVEQIAAPQASVLHDGLSQLQLAFVRLGGSAGAAGAGAAGAEAGRAGAAGGEAGRGEAATSQAPGSSGTGPRPGGFPPSGAPGQAPPAGGGGPAQRSGRLWIPGQ